MAAHRNHRRALRAMLARMTYVYMIHDLIADTLNRSARHVPYSALAAAKSDALAANDYPRYRHLEDVERALERLPEESARMAGELVRRQLSRRATGGRRWRQS